MNYTLETLVMAILAFAALGAGQAQAADTAAATPAAEPADAVEAVVITSYGKSLQAAAALKRCSTPTLIQLCWAVRYAIPINPPLMPLRVNG